MSALRRHRDGKVREPGIIRASVEASIHEHVKMMETALLGLTTMDLRRLACSVAEKLGVRHPFSYENKMAGFDWLRGFLARHEDLRVRVPQGNNIARAVAFNRVNLNEFFMAYKEPNLLCW